MDRIRRHPIAATSILAMLALILLLGSYMGYLAYQNYELPFQTQPTRIPVTPFENVPGGFSAPTPLPTAAP